MEFAQLSNDEQVARLQTLAECALSAWELETPRLELIKYRENAVFGVRTGDGGRAVLRVHRPRYRSDRDIRSEIAWMRALREVGVYAPEALETRSGDVLTVVGVETVPEPRQCDMMRWVEGRAPGTLEAGVPDSDAAVYELYRSVGKIAARMHEHGKHWDKPADFTRPAWNVDTLVGDNPVWGRFWELCELTDAQRKVLGDARDRVRERLSRLGPADTLIHGDLVPDNLLVDGATIRVVDFDDCGWSWIAFEMVTSVFPLQLSGGLEAGRAGYLAGYRSVRPFPQDELELFPDLFLARALSYLGWPAGRPEIQSVRSLIPLMAAMITQAAEEYLAQHG